MKDTNESEQEEKTRKDRLKELLESCNIDADLEQAELELNDKFGEM